MSKTSPGIRLAWQIASWEANVQRQEFIQTEHLLIGICSMEKMDILRIPNKLGPPERRYLASERTGVEDIIHSFGITPAVLRRRLREKCPKGRYRRKDKVIHRSRESVKVFDKANKSAGPEEEFNVLHLLAAILKDPTPAILGILEGFRIDHKLAAERAAGQKLEKDTDQKFHGIDRKAFNSIHSFTKNSNVSNLTIMFDDIVGSMALFNKLGDESFYKLIQYHDDTIQRIVNSSGKGEIIKSTGDGLLIIFSSPTTAVQAALEIQKEFLKRNILKVRIGMDLGEVREVMDKQSRDIFGIKVSTANRITAASVGGHVLASRSVFEATQKHLAPEGIKWKFLASRSFKPGEPTIDIYEVFNPEYSPRPMVDLRVDAITVKGKGRSVSLLDEFGRDLTREAREEQIGPHAGRRAEILQIIQTLSQKFSNNPVLVGKAGVGKTALVEALACRLAQGKDQEHLSGKRILALNMGKIIGNRAEKKSFETRFANILEEAMAQTDVIVFLDEIHNYIGVHEKEPENLAANILNPIIIQGDLNFIGATTPEDFKRYIFPDTSLKRGFQRIEIKEPSKRETMEMLTLFRKRLEEFHRVWITDRALEAAIDLSVQFDQEHVLPAKAIDLLDEAGAQVRIPDLSMLEEGQERNLGLQRAGSHTIVNVLMIGRVLAQRTGVPMQEIMAVINEESD
jgi:ATP-dependent Clp protease ATP-binding subunit ClpA